MSSRAPSKRSTKPTSLKSRRTTRKSKPRASSRASKARSSVLASSDIPVSSSRRRSSVGQKLTVRLPSYRESLSEISPLRQSALIARRESSARGSRSNRATAGSRRASSVRLLDPEFVREAMRSVPVVDDEGHTHMIDPVQLDKITSAPHSAHSRASALRGASLGGSSSRRSILVGEPVLQYGSVPASRTSTGRVSNFVSGSASGVANAIQDVGSTIGSTVGSIVSLPARAVASIAAGIGGDEGRTSYYTQEQSRISQAPRPRSVIEGGLTSLGRSIANVFA